MPFAMKMRDGTRPGSPATVFASFLHFDMCFTMWVLLGALGVFIAGALKLDDASKGLMVAIPTLSGSLCRLPVGILSDRFGSKRVGIIMLVFLFIPLTLGLLLPVNFPGILAVGAMLGVAGASFAVALPLASRWYPPEKQGLVMGIAAAGNLGTVFAIIFAPVLAYDFTPVKLLPHKVAAVAAHGKVAAVPAHYVYPAVAAPGGWHAVLGLTMIPLAVVLITFILMAKESPTRPQGLRVASYLRALRKGNVWWFCLLYSVTFGGFVGLGSYLSLFYSDKTLYGLPATVGGIVTFATASGLAALAAFAGSTLRPVGGFIADKIGGTRLLTILLVVIATVYALASLTLSLPYMVVIMTLGVGCLGMGNGAIFQMVPQSFRKEIGVVTGLVGAFGGLGGFALPYLLGSVKQATGSYANGWLILSGFVVFALIVLRVKMATSASWRVSWAPIPEVQLEAAEEELRAVKAEIKALNIDTELEFAKAELEEAKVKLGAMKTDNVELKQTVAALDPALG